MELLTLVAVVVALVQPVLLAILPLQLVEPVVLA
jgi:hypothetical protein